MQHKKNEICAGLLTVNQISIYPSRKYEVQKHLFKTQNKTIESTVLKPKKYYNNMLAIIKILNIYKSFIIWLIETHYMCTFMRTRNPLSFMC